MTRGTPFHSNPCTRLLVCGALGVVLALAGHARAATRPLVVQLNPQKIDVAAPAAASKLSPALQAARAAQAKFVGATRSGDPVLEAAVELTLPKINDALADIQGFEAARDLPPAQPFDRIDELIVLLQPGAAAPAAEPAAAPAAAAPAAIADLAVTHQHHGEFAVVAAKGGITPESLAKLEQDPAVRYVEPNFLYRVGPPNPRDAEAAAAPAANEQELQRVWGVRKIRAPQAWAASPPQDVLVAVLDTGIDLAHDDLKDRLWINTKETRGNQKDDDGNGVIDDIHGANFSDRATGQPPTGDPTDRNGRGHGTHCAGTIAAAANGQGVIGVNHAAHVMAVRILRPSAPETDPTAPGSGIAAAIDYAVKHGAKILSNSWGGGPKSKAIEEAIERAEKANCLFIAAAGNNGNDNDRKPTYPASYDNACIISVAAVDEQDALASFSNFGSTSVDIAAPGVNVTSTLPGNTYGPKEGTSMATPHVAGAVALIWGHPNHSGKSPAEIKQLVLQNARKVPALQGKVGTGGVLDLTFLAPNDTTANAGGAGSGAGAAGGAGAGAGAAATPRPAAGATAAAGATTAPATGGTVVQAQGTIRSDVEIGAETTGAVLEVQKSNVPHDPQTKWELRFQNPQDQQTAMDALSRKSSVNISGKLTRQKGVEVDERHIINVDKIEVAK